MSTSADHEKIGPGTVYIHVYIYMYTYTYIYMQYHTYIYRPTGGGSEDKTEEKQEEG